MPIGKNNDNFGRKIGKFNSGSALGMSQNYHAKTTVNLRDDIAANSIGEGPNQLIQDNFLRKKSNDTVIMQQSQKHLSSKATN